jgi:uncharacterized membrane protein YidH (DUF202 family)
MSSQPVPAKLTRANHEMWVRTRLQLDAEFQEALRHGFSLIAAGFGSFSIFEGLTIGERQVSELPKTFALITTVIGMIVILLAASHLRKMIAWVDSDEFGSESVPQLPDENRWLYLAAAAIVIGAVSFIALLRLPS